MEQPKMSCDPFVYLQAWAPMASCDSPDNLAKWESKPEINY